MKLTIPGVMRSNAFETQIVGGTGLAEGFFVLVFASTITLPEAGVVVPIGRMLGVQNVATSTMTTIAFGVNTINGAAANFSLGPRSFALCIATTNQQWSVTQLGDIGGYRSPSVNTNVTLVPSDAVVELASTTIAAKTITTSTVGFYAGRRVRLVLTIHTQGSYTVPVVRGSTSGTVTMSGLGHGVDMVFSGSQWKLLQLLGGATFA